MSQDLRRDGSPVVGILTGSPSDLEVVTKARDALEELDVPCEVFAMSAHRTPDRVVEYVQSAADRGVLVIIACAGMAAHLAGVVAAHTTLPVIGVPLASGALQGFDSLLSTVQMPPGIPVATVAVGGAENAGLLAAQMIAIGDPALAKRIEAEREARRQKVLEADAEVRAKY